MDESHLGIEAGRWVAIALAPGAAPRRCCVGQVRATDNRGVRLTLLDRAVGEPCGFDVFAPWTSVTSALVATEEHDLNLFTRSAAGWQSACNGEHPDALPTSAAR